MLGWSRVEVPPGVHGALIQGVPDTLLRNGWWNWRLAWLLLGNNYKMVTLVEGNPPKPYQLYRWIEDRAYVFRRPIAESTILIRTGFEDSHLGILDPDGQEMRIVVHDEPINGCYHSAPGVPIF